VSIDVPALPFQPIPQDLVREMAMEVGKEIAAYVEWMYPEAVEATSSVFLPSLRNCIFNEITATLKTMDAAEISERLVVRKRARRELGALWKAARTAKPTGIGNAVDIAPNKAELLPSF